MKQSGNVYKGFTYRALKEYRDYAKKGILTRMEWQKEDLRRNSQFLVRGVPVLDESVKSACIDGKSSPCSVLVATYRFDSVTGIVGDNKSKQVEYRIVPEITPIGRKLDVKFTPQIRSAVFVKYDDGWRAMR